MKLIQCLLHTHSSIFVQLILIFENLVIKAKLNNIAVAIKHLIVQ